jgi:hypothetical protein
MAAVLVPNNKGPWVVKATEDADDLAHPVRGITMHLIEFFPTVAVPKPGRAAQVYVSTPGARPMARDVPIQRFAQEQGHFLMLTGLTRVPALELSAELPPGVNLIFKFTRDMKVFTGGSVVLPAPAECALALIAAPGMTGEVVVRLTVPNASLPDPVLPPLSPLAWPWDPLGSKSKGPKLAQSETQRALRAFQTAIKACDTHDWGRAIFDLEVCVQAVPRSAECHLLLGYARAKSFDRAEALKHYRTFLQLAPQHLSAPSVAQIVKAAAH